VRGGLAALAVVALTGHFTAYVGGQQPLARNAARASQGLRTRLMAVREVSSVAGVDDSEIEASILSELFATASKESQEEVVKMVDENLGRLTPEDMMELQVQLGKDENAAATSVANAVSSAVERRMGAARGVIEDILGSSSEINDVNAKIKKALKEADSPMPLLTVLQLNIVEAQESGEEDKTRALMHINTLINEELEKKAPRVLGLLNKLLRMDDANIRSNILRHHLEPQEVKAALDIDFGDEEDSSDSGSSQPLMAAMVRPSQLASGFSQMVDNVERQFRAAGAEADEVRYDTIDRIRAVAKEARLVVGDIYGEREMDSFSQDLTPAFAKLMAWRATQAKGTEEAKEPVASEEA